MNTPMGYDAICEWCMAAYLFKNAKLIGTIGYKKYCSLSCENHDHSITDKDRERNHKINEELKEKANQEIQRTVCY